jgi:hypothetical protein
MQNNVSTRGVQMVDYVVAQSQAMPKEREIEIQLDQASEALDVLRRPGRRSILRAAEYLLLSMWQFRRTPDMWHELAKPLMEELTAMKEPHFYDDDERELFRGLVADATAFLEHRPMENLPRLVRR